MGIFALVIKSAMLELFFVDKRLSDKAFVYVWNVGKTWSIFAIAIFVSLETDHSQLP